MNARHDGPGAGESRLLRRLSRLVGGDRGGTWYREWLAELAHARRMGRGTARLYAAAVEDGLRLFVARRGRGHAGLHSFAVHQDLRFALRSIRRNPGFATAAVLTLALGVGANAAIFSLLDALVLRPLPLREPERVVVVNKTDGERTQVTSAPDYLDWRAESRTLEFLAAVHSFPANLQVGDVAVRVNRALVTPEMFDVLGVRPVLGRAFGPAEMVAGSERVVILSWELWATQFGGDPGVPGRSVSVDGVAFTVIGVMPRGLRLPPLTPEIWVPLVFDRGALESRGRNNIWAFGRLRAGATLGEAQVEMRMIGDRIAAAYPRSNEGWTADVQQVQAFALGSARGALWKLFAGVAIVLLIACVNVANLVIARGAARRRELAVRASLGASRARLLRELLTESLLLGIFGGVVGIVLGYALLGPVRSLVPAALIAVADVTLDARVLVFGLAAGMGTGLAAGLLPALRLSTIARGSGAVRGIAGTLRVRGATTRAGRTLAAAQFALATVLLVAAVLVGRSLEKLYGTDVGVDYDGVTVFSVTFPEADFDSPDRIRLGVDGVIDGLRSRGGITAVAGVSHLPLTGQRLTSSVVPEGSTAEQSVNGPSAAIRVVTPGYFEVLRVHLDRGRLFDENDGAESEPVAIINETAARQYWPARDPIDRWIEYAEDGSGRSVRRRIVGVVADIRYAGPGVPPMAEVYEPHGQTTEVWGWFGRTMTFVVRPASGRTLALRDVREIVTGIDATLPVVGWSTLAEQLDRTLAAPRFNGALLGSFGFLAIVLAAIGMYGVLAFSVRLRTRELGIRMALGANSGRVLGGVLSEGLTLAVIGATIGIASALALRRILQSFLWGIEPTDGPTFALVLCVLLVATIAASLVPAVRAAAVDPARTLQSE